MESEKLKRHANSALKDEVCACPLDQTLILSLGMGEDRKHRSIALDQQQLPEAHLLKNKIIRNTMYKETYEEAVMKASLSGAK